MTRSILMSNKSNDAFSRENMPSGVAKLPNFICGSCLQKLPYSETAIGPKEVRLECRGGSFSNGAPDSGHLGVISRYPINL
jgi:hypothetical protein